MFTMFGNYETAYQDMMLKNVQMVEWYPIKVGGNSVAIHQKQCIKKYKRNE